MNPLLDQLQPYPFARLREAMHGVNPPEGVTPVSLHIGEPKHPTPEVITNALTASLHELEKYPLTAGLPELRQACADWLQRRYDGLTVNPDTEVLPVLGSREALFSFVQAVLNPVSDDLKPVVLSPNPFYQIYEGAAILGGGEIRFANCPAPSFKPDWKSIAEDVWQRTKVMFVCSPNNPTGPALTFEEIAGFVADVPDDVMIIVDEAYIDFVTDPAVGDALTLLGRHPNLVVSRTFSKAHALAGMRVGYLVGESGIISAIRSVATPFGVCLPAQAAALAALEPAALAETARRAGLVAAERDRVVAGLRGQGWAVPETQGNFFWLGVGPATTALAEHFRSAGILVRPFAGEGVRVSIGTTSDNERVLAAAAAWRAAH